MGTRLAVFSKKGALVRVQEIEQERTSRQEGVHENNRTELSNLEGNTL